MSFHRHPGPAEVNLWSWDTVISVMAVRSIVTPLAMLADPAQNIWPPPRIANWQLRLASSVTAVATSCVSVGVILHAGMTFCSAMAQYPDAPFCSLMKIEEPGKETFDPSLACNWAHCYRILAVLGDECLKPATHIADLYSSTVSMNRCMLESQGLMLWNRIRQGWATWQTTWKFTGRVASKIS